MANFSYRGSFFKFDWRNVGADMPYFDTHNFEYNVRYKLADEIQREAEVFKRQLKHVTQTWEHDVEFYYERRTAGDTFSFVITTDDEIFWYLNNGTKERYAVMTPDFQPKTHVRTIGSQVGQGGFAYIVDTAVDGIEAREWIDEIANRREDNFHNNMNKIFNHILDVYWNRALRKGK